MSDATSASTAVSAASTFAAASATPTVVFITTFVIALALIRGERSNEERKSGGVRINEAWVLDIGDSGTVGVSVSLVGESSNASASASANKASAS
jgi:hypothetical protein